MKEDGPNAWRNILPAGWFSTSCIVAGGCRVRAVCNRTRGSAGRLGWKNPNNRRLAARRCLRSSQPCYQKKDLQSLVDLPQVSMTYFRVLPIKSGITSGGAKMGMEEECMASRSSWPPEAPFVVHAICKMSVRFMTIKGSKTCRSSAQVASCGKLYASCFITSPAMGTWLANLWLLWICSNGNYNDSAANLPLSDTHHLVDTSNECL